MVSDSRKVLGPVTATVLLLCVAFLVAGCGVDQSPMAATDESLAAPEIAQASDGRAFLTFSPEASRGAGKIASAGEGVTASGLVGIYGGELQIEKQDDRGVVVAIFAVPEGALTSPVEITMTVYGYTLEELVVAFDPGGLTFLQEAVLDLEIGNGLVSTPLEDIRAWHEGDDGTVDEANLISALERGNKVKLAVGVPHFSSYGLRD